VEVFAGPLSALDGLKVAQAVIGRGKQAIALGGSIFDTAFADEQAGGNWGRPDVRREPLYGALSPDDQDRAIAPRTPAGRKVVLATAIADTKGLTSRGRGW